MNNLNKVVDIDRILRDKMGAKARFVPPFVSAYIKHIIHEDWVNAFLTRAADKQGVDWLEDCLDYMGITLDVRGEENLPPAGNGKLCTFVSNHPLGGIDGVAVGAVIGRKYGNNFKYLVNDLLMNLPGLATLCVAVNKTGKNGRNFPKTVEAAFKTPQHILMFPAGLCSRKSGGVIHDLPWKKTFITKSIETRRDIVPVYFEGRNSDFFYNIAAFGKRLRLKFNIAMLFLADELYKNCNNTYRIVFGKPVPVETFGKERSHAQWAQWVSEQVYALAEDSRCTTGRR